VATVEGESTPETRLLALLNPQTLLEQGGLLLLAALVFAESGLLIGAFLPGDSLLFIAGFLTSSAGVDVVGSHVLPPLAVVALVAFIAAVVGDQVGYIFGRRVGPYVFRRPDARVFKQQHVFTAQEFFERHGPKTIVLARFVPIVRTFAPVVAGTGRMPYRTFVTYNILGAFLWAVGLTVLGHYLGQVDAVKDHIELALIAIVGISLLPVVREVAKSRKERRHLALGDAPVVDDDVR
jgi:membrane-associated protein